MADKSKNNAAKTADGANKTALLYRIAKAMAAVKDGRELLKIIVDETQPVFGFYDIGLAVLDESGEFYFDWAVLYQDISPSQANLAQRENRNYKFSIDEPLMKYALARFDVEKKPFISDLTTELVEEFPEFSQFPIEIEYGYKQFLVTTLKFGGEILGLLTFNSVRENHFESCDLELFQAIADLVAVAIANITANEEIVERAREKEILLSISQAIATIQNPQQLFKVIFERVQPIFGFHDVGLFVLSKDGTQITDWAAAYSEINPSAGNRQLKQLAIETTPFAGTPLESVAEQLTKKSPLVFDYAQTMIGATWDADLKAKVTAVIEENGYREFLAAQLKTGGVMSGLLFFNSKQSRFFSYAQFAMFQSVADQVAVAVANILANEEILEREGEKSKLLSISREIAKVQTRRQLLNVIFTTIKEIFPYDDAGLFYFCDADGTLNPHGDNYVHLLDGVVSEVNAEIAERRITGVLSERLDSIRFCSQDHAGITTLDELMTRFPGHPFFPIMQRDGIRQFITKGIKVGGETIGMLSFNSRTENFYTESDFPMFDNIANQVAVAVANILANEEIAKREREKSVLLSISRVIATVRSKKDLLQLIVEKIKPVFNFHDCGIFVFDRDQQTLEDLTVSLPNISPSETNNLLAQNDAAKFQFRGSAWESVFAIMRAAGKPIIFDYRENQAAGWSDYVQSAAIDEAGYAESLMTILATGGEELGVFAVNSLDKGTFSEHQFALFQNIANQMAVAVANIVANEDILEREREKSQLLEISSVIAKVQTRGELLRAIYQSVKSLLPHDDIGLFLVNEETDDHYEIIDESMFTPNDNIMGSAVWNEYGRGPFAHRGSGVDLLMEKVAVRRISDFDGSTHPYIPIMRELGLKEFLGGALVVNGKKRGMFSFNSKTAGVYAEKDFPVFQGILDQISIALSNILAKEEILERAREKSVLLSISEDIASARNAVELMQIIREKAQKLIPFFDTGILIVEDGGAYHYDLAVNLQGWDNSESNQKLHELGLHRMIHPASYVEYVMNLIEAANRPVIEDYETRYREFDYPFFQLLEELGYKEGIAAALKSGGKTFGTLWLNSLEKNQFKPAQFEVFQALADQVAVAVANILANDEIKNQLREITDLKKRLEAENKYLTEEVRRNYNFDEIIGTSPRLQAVFEIIETVAPTDATVLIQGETGTGKELAARAVHNRSTRNNRPLIKINCAALPRELVESELFGHEKGSFTGAFEKRLGKFELADKGTIFLDEIGELPLDIQVKLLRVLQEREIERLGGKGTIKLDLRVVAATNRNLAQEVSAGRFRADLYYRLCTVELFMPSLRERREDIEPLTLYFAQKYAAKFSRNIERISTQMLAELTAYEFPGNIRELEHIVEHAVIFSRDEKLILPRSLTGNAETQIVTNGESTKMTSPKSEKQTLETIERAHIIEVLRQTSGRIKGTGGAAEILGLNPATVYFRMKKLGIEKKRG